MTRSLGRRLICLIATAIMIVGPLSSVAPVGAAGPGRAPESTFLVLAHQGSFAQARSRVIEAGGRIAHEMPELDVLVASSADARFPSRLSLYPAVEGVAADQGIVVLDEALHPLAASAEGPSDPGQPTRKDSLYGLQWDIQRIGGRVDKAWAVTRGNHGVRVAILDTGIYAKHPDLAPNLDLSLSRSFLTNTPPQDPDDLSDRDLAGHGTFVAGQVAGAFGGGRIVGIAPGLSVVNVKTINKQGQLWLSWALPALYYAAANRFEVVNMSWSGVLDISTSDGHLWWKAFQRVTHFADQQGSLLVAAAGNSGQNLTGTNLRRLPAELPEVVAVSATDFQDQMASYSNYGSTIALSAPGGEIPPAGERYPYLMVGAFSSDAVPGRLYAWGAGTSFAAPKVAGTAGLVLSVGRLSVSQLKSKLQQTSEDLGKPGRDEQFGFGLVDADQAVR